MRFPTNHSVKNLKWSPDEDVLLAQIMSRPDRPNYATLAEMFPGKTGQQVAERWDKVLNPALQKGSWTPNEDQIIISFVERNGTKQWQKLCALLPGRIGKQCRERWRNHLDPAINHAPWTHAEDQRLIELHRMHGNAWVKISGLMANRSDNAVKNRWNSTLSKRETGGSVWPTADGVEETEVGAIGPPTSPFVNIPMPVTFGQTALGNLAPEGSPPDAAPSLQENREALRKLLTPSEDV
jgi:hypothetical protein